MLVFSVLQVHFRLGKLANIAEEEEEASDKSQEGPESSTEQLGEDIILQINPASTKNEEKLNKNIANGMVNVRHSSAVMAVLTSRSC